jgi:hypothetical protein
LATLAPDGALQLTRMIFELPANVAFMVDLARLPETTQGRPGSAHVVCAMAARPDVATRPRAATESVVAKPRSTNLVRGFAVGNNVADEADGKADGKADGDADDSEGAKVVMSS